MRRCAKGSYEKINFRSVPTDGRWLRPYSVDDGSASRVRTSQAFSWIGTA